MNVVIRFGNLADRIQTVIHDPCFTLKVQAAKIDRIHQLAGGTGFKFSMAVGLGWNSRGATTIIHPVRLFSRNREGQG
jgi:hypothetical protein